MCCRGGFLGTGHRLKLTYRGQVNTWGRVGCQGVYPHPKRRLSDCSCSYTYMELIFLIPAGKGGEESRGELSSPCSIFESV